MERFSRQPQPAVSAPHHTSAPAPVKNKKNDRPSFGSKLLVIVLIVAALSITSALAAGVWKSFDTTNTVNSNLYQAVFLDNGQVYFGKLANLNSEYAQLTDIYYLQVDQQVQPDQSEDPQQQISLAKLGNELHGPEDRMFINADKIVFWENLKTDGQVTEAIVQYQSDDNSEDQ